MASKISVIVPVYKVEKYLGKCVDSIRNQTYQNLEIILVDDGSPDGCGALCEEYAKIDHRIKVIHKINGGLSSARNAGLDVATGEYVGFVDSDDYILPQMYEKLLAALQKNQADISICGYAYVDEETGVVDSEKTNQSPLKTGVLTRIQAYKKINPSQTGYSFYVTAWNKLYKRSLFEQVRFKDGYIHEDEFSVHHIFHQSQRIAVIEDVMYMYLQRNGSITNVKVSVKSLDAVFALMDRHSFFVKEGEPALATDALRSANWLLAYLLPQLTEVQNHEKVNQAVALVGKAMLRNLDPRVMRLAGSWLGYCLKGTH